MGPWLSAVEVTDVLLTERATGSSIVSAKTVSETAARMFFMVD